MIIPREPGPGRRNDESAKGRISSAILVARQLIRYGMPVFPGRVDDEGNPDRDDMRWARWHRYPADVDILDSYRYGDALAALCGITFDVIDIDPRNGGQFSAKRMFEELGDFGPVSYGRVRTPSGGLHIYIASLGIGSHNGILPGIDLKGGFPDGTGRGFVFIPPTIRPVKGLEGEGGVIAGVDAVDRVRMGTYKWSESLRKPAGDPSSEELASYILSAVEDNRAKRRSSNGTGREEPDKLRAACISAESGGQRQALLRYVHELERKGYARKDILVLLRSLAGEMPVYDKRRPWFPASGGNPDRELVTLLHRPGEVMPDATIDEAEILDGIAQGPSVAKVLPKGLTSFAEVERGLIEWLWLRYLAVGDITILDGDAGIAKSLVSLDISSRVTTGNDMPDGSAMRGAPGGVLLLAPEDSDKVTAGRLEAANANMSMIYRPALVLKRIKGVKDPKAYSGGELLSFPGAVEKVRRWIIGYGIRLLVVDPIAAFLDEKVNSNNDASVRRALAPLSAMLSEVGCSALFIRHLNKNTELTAAHRGGGSVAFGAISRCQLIAGDVPIEFRERLPDADLIAGRVFGIQQVKNNNLERRPDHTLCYMVEDSDVVADTEGNMAPRIKWLGEVLMSADDLVSTSKTRKGPAPMVQDEVIEVLTDMFNRSPIWDSADALAEIKSAGISANRETIAKARARMGIIPKARRDKGVHGVTGWDWHIAPKERVSDEEED